jgi:hypothetical protein
MPILNINSKLKNKLCNSMQTNTKQKRVPKITKTNPFCCNPMRSLGLREIERCYAQIRSGMYLPCDLTFSLQNQYNNEY